MEHETEPKENPTLEGFTILEEQTKDEQLVKIKRQLEQGVADQTTHTKFLTIDDVLFYISQVDDEPTLRLYIPSHLQQQIIKDYHENGHFAVDKVFQAIREKYYWPNLYKQIKEYIDKCIQCKVRNMQPHKAPLQETSIPAYPMAVLALDLSGPYRKTLSGNVYICSFIDVYSGWLEAYAIPDKSADTIVTVLLEEIIVRHSTPLKIISDNGTEFVNRSFAETLKRMNIIHAKTSFYHPTGNARVERSHRVLHDCLAKIMEGQVDNWDTVLNSALYAMRCQISKTTKMSPFFLLYNRQPVLPIDNILQPRRKYMGEDFFEHVLENQHKMFMLVHKNLKEAKIKQAEYTVRKNKCREISYKIGTMQKQQSWKTIEKLTMLL